MTNSPLYAENSVENFFCINKKRDFTVSEIFQAIYSQKWLAFFEFLTQIYNFAHPSFSLQKFLICRILTPQFPSFTILNVLTSKPHFQTFSPQKPLTTGHPDHVTTNPGPKITHYNDFTLKCRLA
jgi:hypothetical protein